MFNKYPYTDFHELNLDWFLSEFKKLTTQFDTMKITLDDILNYMSNMPDVTSANIQHDIMLAKRGRLFVDRLSFNTLAQMGNQACDFYNGYYYTVGQIGSVGVTYLSKFDDTGTLMLQNQINIGHGNSIAIADGYLYIAGDNGMFHKVDTDLQYVEQIDVTSLLQTSAGVGYDNGIIYFYGRSKDDYNTMRIVSYSNGTLSKKCEFLHPVNTVVQGFCVYNGYGYALFNRSTQIYEVYLGNGVITNIYNVPDGDGLFPTGECEDLFVLNGSIYLWTALYYPNRYGTDISTISSGESIGLMFETNITKQIGNDNRRDYLDTEQNFNVIYNGDAVPEFNPYMTVTTATEASMLINYHKYGTILASNIKDGSVFCFTNCRCTFVGSAGDRNVKVLQAVQCDIDVHNIQLENVYYNRGTFLWAGGNQALLNRVYFINANVQLNGVNLSLCTVISNTSSQITIDGCSNTAIPVGIYSSSGTGRCLKAHSSVGDRTNIHHLLELAPGGLTIDVLIYSRRLSIVLQTADTSTNNWFKNVNDSAGLYDKLGVDLDGDLSVHRITENDYIKVKTIGTLCYVTLSGYTI